ncbi:MAG TPA: hypothetical protein VH969_14135 [Actinophytocola sp.]|uniref:hypothetical protein n=1 Tax=Actinophytocola sp. TaxID=1872138 RepID=UPI002F93B4BE
MRRLFLLTLPGLLVGFIAGVFAGGLTAFVGQPAGAAVVAALALGVPLALMGGGYTMLLINKRVRLGGFAPAALFWLIGFPLARLLHELAVTWYVGGTPTFPPDTLGFLAFQGILSLGFAIGFLWLHERVAPRWWARLAQRGDEVAEEVYLRYASHARAMFEAKERRKAATSRNRAARKTSPTTR